MNSSPPRISVIIPTYNSAKHIVAAIDSMLCQRLAPTEIVISDDGSSDDTIKILEAMRARSAVPIRIHVNPSPCGLTNNYLHAASHTAESDLIVVADHDDVWLPDRLGTIAAAFAASPDTVVVCCDSTITDEELHPSRQTLRGGRRRSRSLCRRLEGQDSLAVYLRGGLPWAAHALSFRRSLLPLILGRPAHIDGWYFEEFVVAMGAVVGTVLFIPESLTLYRQHASQTTRRPAPPPTSAPAGTGRDTDSDPNRQRIEKIRHCRRLLQELPIEPGTEADARRHRRVQFCDEALEYCTSRRGWLAPPVPLPQFGRSYLKLIRSGAYGRYGRGIQSMAADLLRYLTARRHP